MLSMSAGDEAELQSWRTKSGRCQLPTARMRIQPSLETVLERLPSAMSLMLRARQKAGGWLGALRLEPSEVAEIESATKTTRREMMLMLLDVASSLAQTPVEGEHIGAVAEGQSGGLYLGAPLSWRGGEIRFSTHGVQAAVLNAWNQGELSVTSLMVEVLPCACCRQFLRELKDWKTLKILQAVDGPLSLQKGEMKATGLGLEGLRADGIKAKLMGEPKRTMGVGKMSTNDLIKLAATSAAASYAPYSRNYAGVALRTRRGDMHHGCYVETRESVAGILAIEAALMDLVIGGGQPTDVNEIVLVETRGSVTQFAATQKLAMAMGNIPFRYMMAT